MAYSQGFDNIFALSCREPKEDITQNSMIVHEIKKGIVSVRGMICDEWPHIKYCGSSIVLLQLIDVSLLLLAFSDA